VYVGASAAWRICDTNRHNIGSATVLAASIVSAMGRTDRVGVDDAPDLGGSHWRRMRVWASAHAVDDFYQGLVPAAVPSRGAVPAVALGPRLAFSYCVGCAVSC